MGSNRRQSLGLWADIIICVYVGQQSDENEPKKKDKNEEVKKDLSMAVIG